VEFLTSEQLNLLIVDYGTRVVGALAIFFAAIWLSGKFSNLATAAMDRAKIDMTLTRFVGKAVRWLILIVVLISILGVFGVQTTSFAALIAASGLAVGLAFQGTLSNIAAGIMLLIFRPFQVGQFIKVAGEMGTVYEIDLFTTKLDTPDNRQIILPNSAVFGTTIENVSYHPRRRVDVLVGVDYGADIDQTRAVLQSALCSVEGLEEGPNPPVAILSSLGDSSVEWQLRGWCKSSEFWPTREAMLVAAKKALDESNISIPFPQMDIHVKTSDTQYVVQKNGASRPASSLNAD